jgi:hypothetical protein
MTYQPIDPIDIFLIEPEKCRRYSGRLPVILRATRCRSVLPVAKRGRVCSAKIDTSGSSPSVGFVRPKQTSGRACLLGSFPQTQYSGADVPPLGRPTRHPLAPGRLASHDVKQPGASNTTLRSRGATAPGLASFHPNRGVGGAPTGARVQRHPVGLQCAPKTRVNALMALQAGHPAGCPASLAIGTRASRRSTLAIFGFGSALPAPAFPPKHVQRAPRSTGHSARRAVSEPPEVAVTSRSRGTPILAPPSGPSLEDAPHERGCPLIQ